MVRPLHVNATAIMAAPRTGRTRVSRVPMAVHPQPTQRARRPFSQSPPANCLSALMSFGTIKFIDMFRRERQKSQLPFGFDVDWYVVGGVVGGTIVAWSQLPFGFDVDWYGSPDATTTSKVSKCHNCLSALRSIGTFELLTRSIVIFKESQLPFGFDGDWYFYVQLGLQPVEVPVTIAFRL